MKKKNFYYTIPPFIRYYLTAIIVVAFNIKYKKRMKFKLVDYLSLNYKKVFQQNQYWRLFTNIVVINRLSRHLIFFCLFFYIHFERIELRAIKQRKYAEFLMMIFYLLVFINIANIIYYYYENKSYNTLAYQLLSAVVFINCQKNPHKLVRIYRMRVKNYFFPFIQILIHIIENRSIFENMIGYLTGYLYLYLKEDLSAQKNIDILITPKFLKDFVEDNMFFDINEFIKTKPNTQQKRANYYNKNRNRNRNNEIINDNDDFEEPKSSNLCNDDSEDSDIDTIKKKRKPNFTYIENH